MVREVFAFVLCANFLFYLKAARVHLHSESNSTEESMVHESSTTGKDKLWENSAMTSFLGFYNDSEVQGRVGLLDFSFRRKSQTATLRIEALNSVLYFSRCFEKKKESLWIFQNLQERSKISISQDFFTQKVLTGEEFILTILGSRMVSWTIKVTDHAKLSSSMNSSDPETLDWFSGRACHKETYGRRLPAGDPSRVRKMAIPFDMFSMLDLFNSPKGKTTEEPVVHHNTDRATLYIKYRCRLEYFDVEDMALYVPSSLLDPWQIPAS